jgi:hypothetical protein
MPTHLPSPTIEDVERITQIDDPVLRNLAITQCYHELSAVLARRTGPAANWCTFATWASKQAGQTIRKEDLVRLVENRLLQSSASLRASQQLAAAAGSQGSAPAAPPQLLALSARSFMAAIDRASDAVSRGNKKVFEEIGYEFARFHHTCLLDLQPDEQSIARFCASLRAGDPPDGQGTLRQAFRHYYQAMFEPDAKTQAELIFLANIEIGFHEQTRLQPEIAESLDTGMISFLDFARPLFGSIFPWRSWVQLALVYLRRVLGRPTVFDLAVQAMLTEVKIQVRKAVTELMMTISFPSGELLKLSKDLVKGFPASLNQITNPDCGLFLEKYDVTANSLRDSGVFDWADLPDRLHYIIDLFRCYQEQQNLFEPPFTAEQVSDLKAGRLPAGRL